MRHVDQQPEPSYFDDKVRQRGLAWLTRQHIAFNRPCAIGTVLEPYWRVALGDLYDLYGGYCAYVAVRFEIVTATPTVDHFVPKSQLPANAYEWSNYRLACARMNARKNVFDDVLDPFEIEDGWFQLDSFSGSIHPNQALDPITIGQILGTIKRLNLNDPNCCALRRRIVVNYAIHQQIDLLRRESLFIFGELKRQGLL